MSLSLFKYPQELMPVYNQVIIVATSSEMTELNYQLVTNITCRGELVSRLKTPINPEGFLIVDLHKHLENKISFDFTGGGATYGFSPATSSFASYSVTFADEFRAEWNFTDNFFSSIGGTGFVGFVSGEEPYFSIGDEVYISQDAGFTNASYNGVHEIIAISQSGLTYSITIDSLFELSTPAEPGVMTYANFQLTTLPIVDFILHGPTGSSATSSLPKTFAFNGVLSYLDFINWDFLEYRAGTASPGEFLTNVPEGYKVDVGSNMFLNLYQANNSIVTNARIISSLGSFTVSNSFITPVTNVQQRCLRLNVSPKLLLDAGFIAEGEDWTVEGRNASGITIAQKRFRLEDKCSRYEKMQIIFMDKLGSFIPFTFDRVSRETRNISRSNYQENYGSYAPATQTWGYRTFDRGKKSLDTVVSEQYVLNSDFVDQKTSDYLMELFESPEVYWCYDNQNFVAINVTVASTERKKVINEQLINYVLTFELSNKNMSQR